MKALKLQVQAMKPRNCGSNFKSTGVQSLGKKPVARPGCILFWGIFVFHGMFRIEWNVWN
jgi:hypothetical protein